MPESLKTRSCLSCKIMRTIMEHEYEGAPPDHFDAGPALNSLAAVTLRILRSFDRQERAEIVMQHAMLMSDILTEAYAAPDPQPDQTTH